MSFEQRNADFCKAQTDVQMAYIEAEREVKQLKAESAKLRELVRDAIYARDDADWASIVSTAIALGVEVDA